jgi:hypothetical protein
MITPAQREYDDHCQFEDQLINHRLTWLLASEALLFAGYGAIQSSDRFSQGQVSTLTTPLFVVGLVISILIFLSVLAAAAANLHNWRDLKADDPKVTLGVRAYTTIVGWGVAASLPLVFALGWLLIRFPTS